MNNEKLIEITESVLRDEGVLNSRTKGSLFALIKTYLDGCEGFEEPCGNKSAEWVERGTRYEDKKKNWAYLCSDCKELEQNHWSDMLQEYNASRFG